MSHHSANDSDSGNAPADRFDHKLESLLPAPEQEVADTGQITVDSPLDTLLPTPRQKADDVDDASTREELEVDTSNDGEDDVIRVGPNSR